MAIPIHRAMDLVLIDLQSNKAHPARPLVTLAPANNALSKSEPVNRPGDPTLREPNLSPSLPPAIRKPVRSFANNVLPATRLIRIRTNRDRLLRAFSGVMPGPLKISIILLQNKNSGIVWDGDILRKYLAAPQSVVPGTKMTFIGLKDPQQVEDVIAYLKEATKIE